ncbi:hypothetical protein NDU88_005082 [Pleurodeles waltl]|uniref:Uncharacterized protein n=1 Tax=Pleurodeles waltl TaxID=8319 RepID=A0AAV7MBW0_PLEWA|nr:hypothetical protein NDU88_005082 [Pleurodeles waltl]
MCCFDPTLEVDPISLPSQEPPLTGPQAVFSKDNTHASLKGEKFVSECLASLSKQSPMKCGLLNARSLVKHSDEINMILESENLDVLFVIETWTTAKSAVDLHKACLIAAGAWSGQITLASSRWPLETGAPCASGPDRQRAETVSDRGHTTTTGAIRNLRTAELCHRRATKTADLP